MSLCTEHNAKRSFYEKRLFVSTRPVLSISSSSFKGSIAKSTLFIRLAQKCGLVCVSRQGDSFKLVFATKSAQKAALERCKSTGIDAETSDSPASWNPPFGLESFASSEDRHFFVGCLDLTLHSKSFESDQLGHQDWDHNYRWFALVKQLRYPPGGFFVSQDVLAGIESIEANRKSRQVGQNISPAAERTREDHEIGEETLVDPESEVHLRNVKLQLLAPAPLASSSVAALEASVSPQDRSSAPSLSLEPPPLAIPEALRPVRSVSTTAVATSSLTPPPPVHVQPGLARSKSAPIRGVPIQIPQNTPVKPLPLAPPDAARPALASSSLQRLKRSGLVDTVIRKELEGLVKTWGPVTSILRIPQEIVPRIVGQRGQTVKLMVEKSQVGIQILPSLRKEWSLNYLAGSKRGEDIKAIELITARMREVGEAGWSSEENFVALS
ncbi:hypothetical protein JCM3765_002634 [Sporobolomyces pararoseus]